MPSTRSRTLFIVRHGETTWNREGRYQGQSDVPLSDTGRGQARVLRDRLGTAHPHLFDGKETHVVASDLSRAWETAEIAFGVPGRVVARDPGLREYRYGILEGLTRAEIHARHPGVLERWRQGERTLRLEGGESAHEVHLRAHAAVTRHLEQVTHGHLVAVVHGGVMRQLLHTCFAEAPHAAPELTYENVAVYRVRIDQDRWMFDGRV